MRNASWVATTTKPTTRRYECAGCKYFTVRITRDGFYKQPAVRCILFPRYSVSENPEHLEQTVRALNTTYSIREYGYSLAYLHREHPIVLAEGTNPLFNPNDLEGGATPNAPAEERIWWANRHTVMPTFVPMAIIVAYCLWEKDENHVRSLVVSDTPVFKDPTKYRVYSLQFKYGPGGPGYYKEEMQWDDFERKIEAFFQPFPRWKPLLLSNQ